MTVGLILASKGRDVVTIPPHRTLTDAVQLLAEKRIGAVIVAGADGKVLGILSERDIVRALAAGSHVMGDPVSRGDIMEDMTSGRFRHMPVVEGGRLAGIISIGDVVKFRLAEFQHEAEALKEYITVG